MTKKCVTVVLANYSSYEELWQTMTNYDVTIANYDVTSYLPEVNYSSQVSVIELPGATFRLKPYRFAMKEDPEDFRLSLRDGSWVSSDQTDELASVVCLYT